MNRVTVLLESSNKIDLRTITILAGHSQTSKGYGYVRQNKIDEPSRTITAIALGVSTLFALPALAANPGDLIGNPIVIADSAPNLAASSFSPAIASDPAGNFLAVWTAGRGGGYVVPQSYVIVGRRYSADGIPLGDAFEISSAIDSSNGFAGYPRVAMDSGGDFVVVWTESDDADAVNIFRGIDTYYVAAFVRYRSVHAIVHARTYSATADALGDDIVVADMPREYSFPAPNVAMDSDGDFAVAWSSIESSPQVQFSLGGLSASSFKYHDEIHARRFTRAGTPRGRPMVVDNARVRKPLLRLSSQGRVAFSPEIGMDGSGNFTIAWLTSAASDGADIDAVMARQYDSNGRSSGSKFQINASPLSTNSGKLRMVMNEAGQLAAVWSGCSTTASACARVFQPDGTPDGVEVPVDDDLHKPPYGDIYPEIAIDATGDFVVSLWRSDGISPPSFRLFSANGTPLTGSNQSLAREPSSDRTDIGLAMSAAGNITAVWLGAQVPGELVYVAPVLAQSIAAP